MILMLGIEFSANALEPFAHGAGRVGTRADFGGDAPNQRDKRRRPEADQRDTGITPCILTDAVGNEESRTESDGDLRKTNDSRNGEVFAKLVQGEL